MTRTLFLSLAAERGVKWAVLWAQCCGVCLAQCQLWALSVKRF